MSRDAARFKNEPGLIDRWKQSHFKPTIWDVDFSGCDWEWIVWVGVDRVGQESIGVLVKENERKNDV